VRRRGDLLIWLVMAAAIFAAGYFLRDVLA
jgi:hypothetical protein